MLHHSPWYFLKANSNSFIRWIFFFRQFKFSAVYPNRSSVLERTVTEISLCFGQKYSNICILTRYVFSNIKLLLEHREYDNNGFLLGRTNYDHDQFYPKYTAETWKKIGQFLQVSIHFNPVHPQQKIMNTSFFALVGEFSTRLNHYFNVSVDTDMIFGYSKWH